MIEENEFVGTFEKTIDHCKWDYDFIKAEAKRRKADGLPLRTVRDLIVLANRNDPFYSGAPAPKSHARWLADIWERFGYTNEIHLRRIHYRVVSQETPVLKVDGKPYQNTDKDWYFLCEAACHARYQGLIDPGCFVDRRAPEPKCFDEFEEQNRIDIGVDEGYFFEPEFDLPELPGLSPAPDFKMDTFLENQKYMLEIWAEKSTMNDILEPLCRQYKMNLVTGVGELSVTHVWKLLIERVRRSGKPCRIFYISDFDPAGQSMPVAVSRKIEFFLRMDSQFQDLDIRLETTLLTYEQCKEYQLPRTPIKEKEKRGANFEKKFGAGQTELDALEALYPGELKKLLTKKIEQYHDVSLSKRTWKFEQEIRKELLEHQEDVTEKYQSQLDQIQERYDEIEEAYQSMVSPLFMDLERLLGDYGSLQQAIKEDLEENIPDFSDRDFPETQAIGDIGESLYQSERPYLDQLKFYKNFQQTGGVNNDI